MAWALHVPQILSGARRGVHTKHLSQGLAYPSLIRRRQCQAGRVIRPAGAKLRKGGGLPGYQDSARLPEGMPDDMPWHHYGANVNTQLG
jgi:hypothetical protein